MQKKKMNSKTDDKMSKNFHGICQKELLCVWNQNFFESISEFDYLLKSSVIENGRFIGHIKA